MKNKDSAFQSRMLIGIALLVAAAIMIYVALSSPRVFYTQQTVTTTAAATEQQAETTTVTYPLNINTATVDELVTIWGIGEGIARSIVMYRTEHGPYKSLDELKKIRGINDRVLSDISPYLTV